MALWRISGKAGVGNAFAALQQNRNAMGHTLQETFPVAGRLQPCQVMCNGLDVHLRKGWHVCSDRTFRRGHPLANRLQP